MSQPVAMRAVARIFHKLTERFVFGRIKIGNSVITEIRIGIMDGIIHNVDSVKITISHLIITLFDFRKISHTVRFPGIVIIFLGKTGLPKRVICSDACVSNHFRHRQRNDYKFQCHLVLFRL